MTFKIDDLSSAFELRKGATVVRIGDKLGISWTTSEEGQTMAEYAVVLTVISAALIAVLGILRDEVISAVTQMAGFV